MQPVEGLLDVIVRLGAAVLCGAALGWEREVQDKPAGLRTHMMVALGAASFTVITLMLAANHARFDPLRVVDGVVGGIGFLGAGAIIQSRGAVRGITTAAGIWVIGAIGVACGVGHYDVAVTTSAFAVAILSGIGYVEMIFSRNHPRAPAEDDAIVEDESPDS